MNRRRFLQQSVVAGPLASAFLGVSGASLVSGQQPAAVKVALLVGVNQYDKRGFRPLEYAERDVTDVANELRKHGFTVELLLGSSQGAQRATKANIGAALERVLKGRNARDVVFVGFAGHGEQRPLRNDKGEEQQGPDGKTLEDAYFCPADAVQLESETMVSLTGLMATLNRKGGINLVMVDACRDNPDPSRGSRSITGNELVGRLPSNTAILFSCAAGQQAWETDKAGSGHGVFFHQVLEGLRGEAAKRNGDVTWGSLVEHVTDHTNSRAKEWLPEQADYWAKRRKTDVDNLPFQTPHELKNLIDQPVLARVKLPSVPMPPTPPLSAPKLLVAPFGESEAKAAQRAWASHLKVEPELKNELGMRFALIPPGEFQMGSPANEAERLSEKTPHRVRITKPFFLGVYEVTQGEWETVMGRQPSSFSRSGFWEERVAGQDTSRFPVENVSWEEATEYCRKLSAREGRTYRLPTEAEWEYACRAGTTSAFHFGDTLNGDKANIDGNSPYGTTVKGKYLERTTRVGSYVANAFGLYDMHGNVWEWCQDWYAEAYDASQVADPVGPAEGSDRVQRGGSWGSPARICRSAYRNRDAPGFRSLSDQGFRLALVESR